MNKNIKNILLKIEAKGYEAYIVGGFVRDYLLNIKSTDIDIATNMPINELKTIFDYTKSFDKYNSIKFSVDIYDISITTYRKELAYEDNKPNKIIFTDSIIEDALRRDFTINAIYMDKEMNIIDPLDGLNDLNNKTIKVIGNLKDRLLEDNTRIIRAIRLMCVLNFSLEAELNNFIINNKELLNNINYNRKKIELDKIFKSFNYMIFFQYIKDNELSDYFGLSFDKIKKANNYLGVWAQLNVTKKYIFTKKEKKIISCYLKYKENKV